MFSFRSYFHTYYIVIYYPIISSPYIIHNGAKVIYHLKRKSYFLLFIIYFILVILYSTINSKNVQLWVK